MAIEPKRGCGWRKINGLYLVSDGGGVPCDRLPFPLHVCPVCSGGIKQSRGWTYVNVSGLFGGSHTKLTTIDENALFDEQVPCGCFESCPLCRTPEKLGKAGLLWIGERFYKTPLDFEAEGRAMGFSRRIKAIPRGFEVGKTWVLLAHPKAIRTEALETDADGTEIMVEKFQPGIFKVWRPTRIEKILPESKRGTEEVQELEDRGLTIVYVPDNDPDHKGTVYDKEEE